MDEKENIRARGGIGLHMELKTPREKSLAGSSPAEPTISFVVNEYGGIIVQRNGTEKR